MRTILKSNIPSTNHTYYHNCLLIKFHYEILLGNIYIKNIDFDNLKKYLFQKYWLSYFGYIRYMFFQNS